MQISKGPTDRLTDQPLRLRPQFLQETLPYKKSRRECDTMRRRDIFLFFGLVEWEKLDLKVERETWHIARKSTGNLVTFCIWLQGVSVCQSPASAALIEPKVRSVNTTYTLASCKNKTINKKTGAPVLMSFSSVTNTRGCWSFLPFSVFLSSFLFSLLFPPIRLPRAKRRGRQSRQMNYEFCLVIFSVSRCCWKISEHGSSGWFKHGRTTVIQQEMEKKQKNKWWSEVNRAPLEVWCWRVEKKGLEVKRQANVAAAVTLTAALSLINSANGATPTFTFQRKYVNDCQRRRTPSDA